MRKKVLGLVIAALSFSAFGTFAQSEVQTGKASCEQTSNCKKGDKNCKKVKKDGKNFKKEHKGHDSKMSRINPFDGIELTAEQKQQIEALKAERKAKMGKEKDKREAQKKAAKEARAQEKMEFDKKVAQILTPEQYAQYQSNCQSIKTNKEISKDCRKSDVKKDCKAKGRKSGKEFQKTENSTKD